MGVRVRVRVRVSDLRALALLTLHEGVRAAHRWLERSAVRAHLG